MMRLGALLAAGRSTRFGPDDKLLAPWRGRPLVSWAAGALREAGCDDLIAVISSPAVGAVLPPEFALHPVGPGLPMSESLREALRVARRKGADGLLLCLGDMPNVTPDLLRALLALPGSGACVQGNRRLPPACVAAGDFDRALGAGAGDHGARDLIAALPAHRLIPVSPEMAHDIDRPGDLASP